MSEISAAFLGDVVGAPGRRAFAHAAQELRSRFGVQVVIVNAENARHGRGLHPEGYRELRDAGADIITLGDHALDDVRIAPFLADPGEPIARPCNFQGGAGSKPWTRGRGPAEGLGVITVLGRLFMKEDRGNPFAALDRELERLAGAYPALLFIVEVHAEATSEKIAMAHHCAGRWGGVVVAVVGTHTHVPTADARIIPPGVAAVTDLGMCGGHAGVIGFTPASSLRIFAGASSPALEIEEHAPAATGCIIRIDTERRAAVDVQTIRIEAPEVGA